MSGWVSRTVDRPDGRPWMQLKVLINPQHPTDVAASTQQRRLRTDQSVSQSVVWLLLLLSCVITSDGSTVADRLRLFQ